MIYADVLFQYNKQKGTCKEFTGNLKGHVFLAASRDHICLLTMGVPYITFHVHQLSPESQIVNTSATLIPAKAPICQCHLWTQVTHNMQPILQGREI